MVFEYICPKCEKKQYTSLDHHYLIEHDEDNCDLCHNRIYPSELYNPVKENMDIINKYWYCLDDLIRDVRKEYKGDLDEE